MPGIFAAVDIRAGVSKQPASAADDVATTDVMIHGYLLALGG